ncbi:sensor histidine kinase [Spirosoma soli]|uniref:Sensor histidine kinase n=1 Tax=Spirosoma soli TaxID=1770529 RepID=A0ABW5M3C8_9BACT
MLSSKILARIIFRRPLWRWHLTAWLIYLIIENGLFLLGTWGHSDAPVRIALIRSLTTFPFVIALFYINAHFLIERYQPQRAWDRLTLATLSLLVGFAACRLILYRYGLEKLGVFDAFEPYGPYSFLTEHFFLDTLWIGLQYLLFSYGYWFARHTLRLEQEKRQLQADLFTSERAKLQAELTFLRNQLNPHFLFNTFNFLYAEAMNCSPKLADSVLSLTVMMRNITELGRKPLIPLSHELEYIHHYLNIQSYRFEEQMNLRFRVEGEEFASLVHVPPLLFISLIENVFKYGDLSEATDPADIHFYIGDEGVRFHCYNRKKDLAGRREASSGGVGLTNIRQQLHQYFPDSCQLTIDESATHYVLKLVIGTTRSALVSTNT